MGDGKADTIFLDLHADNADQGATEIESCCMNCYKSVSCRKSNCYKSTNPR